MFGWALGTTTLGQPTTTLSGGELQRIKLAFHLVHQKSKRILYLFDEPTIGLHQRDNGRLITLLRDIRDTGNSIIVVEHDEQTIRAADYILDLGPGAGEAGGPSQGPGSIGYTHEAARCEAD